MRRLAQVILDYPSHAALFLAASTGIAGVLGGLLYGALWLPRREAGVEATRAIAPVG